MGTFVVFFFLLLAFFILYIFADGYLALKKSQELHEKELNLLKSLRDAHNKQ